MKVKFYGTRGSIPVCHPEYMEFGGNTTCIKIEFDDGRYAILDAGTGIRDLGEEIIAHGLNQDQLYIAFSHFHWDHIQGFPFFKPAYNADMVINVLALGKGREIQCLEEIFATQMQKEFFPVQFDNMGAQFNFLMPNRQVDMFGTNLVMARRHAHPGGAYSYRIETMKGKVLVICTDIEHGTSLDEKIIEFCQGADLLIHDAQYSSEQLERHRGWGHSSYEQALEVARRAGVGRLVMTHHDPSHSDAFLRKMEAHCQEQMPDSLLAREGMVIAF